MLRHHLPALAGKLQQAILVNSVFRPISQSQFSKDFQALPVGQHMLGLHLTGWLA